MGSFGLMFIFQVAMLYRTMDGLETAIIATSYPVNSRLFLSPFLLCTTYLSSSLAPPGTLTNFFGIVTVSVIYLPYLMLGFNLLNGGSRAVAQSLPGALVGHLWWWSVWGDQVGRSGPYAHYGRAPRWLGKWLRDTKGPEEQPAAANMGGGIHVVAPRTAIYLNAGSGASGSLPGSSGGSGGGGGAGYKWGSGQRLGRP
ncbi:hypothetical protein PQX77_005509 [Marasmius sp. AFHP31]|nr:hypothetical protein PQX77_005509 [Marasmius sp. AFHP31]